MKNKYFNKKTGGFDSKKESLIYIELLAKQQQGIISDLQKQPRYCLVEGFTDNQGKKERSINYTPDFYYLQNGIQHVVEVKSSYTKKIADYPIRRKLFKLKYPDIVFVEVVK